MPALLIMTVTLYIEPKCSNGGLRYCSVQAPNAQEAALWYTAPEPVLSWSVLLAVMSVQVQSEYGIAPPPPPKPTGAVPRRRGANARR